MSRRGLAFLLLSLACTVVAVGAVATAALRARDDERESERAAAIARPTVAKLLGDGQPFVLFRNLDRADGATYGRLAIAPLADGRPGERLLAGEQCDRIDLAAGHGLCLGTAGPTGFKAKILDSALRETGSVRLAGVPSRTRVSPDGRYGAVTSFVTGHSYADVGAVLDRGHDHRPALGQEGRRPREGLRDHARRQGGDRPRPQLLGRHLLPRRRHLLRHDGHRRQDVPDQGQPQPAHRRDDPRERRVPGAVARRDADRLQEGGRPRPAGVALPRARPRHRRGDAAGRAGAARRPDRVARRRPRAVPIRRVDVDDAGRRLGQAAALAARPRTLPPSSGSQVRWPSGRFRACRCR